MGFFGLVVGFAAAWRLKVSHYQHLEWRIRTRQMRQTRTVFFSELPWAGLAVAGLILAVRVLF
jgi:hypothetical protein